MTEEVRRKILLNDLEEEIERRRQELLVSIPKVIAMLEVSIEKDKKDLRRQEIVLCVLMPLLVVTMIIVSFIV